MLTLSVHFFAYYGFYNESVIGKSMLLACMVRMLCMTCVPLFMLLTGYLCVNRKWNNAGMWGYYRKLLPILLTYLLSSEVCIVFRMIWLKESYTFQEVLLMATNYNAAPYGWYIEMYIGLFLLSPFFNAAWNSIGERGQKGLLLTLIGMTALPCEVNQLGPILPDWWMGIYPLTYYAMGAWLREHPIKMKPWKLMLCWLGLAALLGVKGYAAAEGGAYKLMYEDNWGSLALLIQSVCLLSCLVQCTGKYTPTPVRWCVSRVAKLSLGMYLVSYVADKAIYPIFIQAVPQTHQRIWWMPVVVPIVIVCSCLMAQLIDWVVEILMWSRKKQNTADAQCRE